METCNCNTQNITTNIILPLSETNLSIHDLFISQDLVSCNKESLHSDTDELNRPTLCLQRSRVTCRGELQCRSERFTLVWRTRYFNLKCGVIEE